MPPTESLSPGLTKAFVQLIVERTGFKIRENDQKVFKDTLYRRAKLTGSDFLEEYYQLLATQTEKSHQEWDSLIVEITNTESFFFRDKGQFNLLKNYIFPDLIKRRADTKTIRICSAGCSTGEEPYSIAMFLRDFIPNIEEWDITILGVDINSAAIKSAKAGIYRPWSFRGIDRHIQNRFFEEVNEQYHISASIKQMVKFQIGNLLDSSFLDPFSDIQEMDLILCRNVFIYFSDSAVETVLNKFYNALSPLGYLLVGHAELYSQNPSNFSIKMFEESIAYQRPVDGGAGLRSSPALAPLRTVPRLRTTADADSQPIDSSLAAADIKMQRAALNLLRQLPADTRMAKFGNLTASELILQFEQDLNKVD